MEPIQSHRNYVREKRYLRTGENNHKVQQRLEWVLLEYGNCRARGEQVNFVELARKAYQMIPPL